MSDRSACGYPIHAVGRAVTEPSRADSWLPAGELQRSLVYSKLIISAVDGAHKNTIPGFDGR